MSRLEGKVAFVTGAASGIGAASVAALAREGAAVVVSDIEERSAAGVAEALSKEGVRAMSLAQDVTDEVAWPKAIDAIEKRFGRLDVVVANAGVAMKGLVTEMSLADWRRQTAINLDGVFLTAKYSIPALRRAGGGSLIIMSSVAGLRGSAGFAGYCATKGGVRFFAKALALECAGLGDAIRVNSIHPGVIDTPLWGTISLGSEEGRPQRQIDAHRMGHNDAPMGRAGTAAEVAEAVIFLASDSSSYMTGAELVLDGGITAGAVPRRKS
jgi:NAD(P)-dependent dehydrogenase (short-subunit alcohol dehydrogenase family)